MRVTGCGGLDITAPPGQNNGDRLARDMLTRMAEGVASLVAQQMPGWTLVPDGLPRVAVGMNQAGGLTPFSLRWTDEQGQEQVILLEDIDRVDRVVDRVGGAEAGADVGADQQSAGEAGGILADALIGVVGAVALKSQPIMSAITEPISNIAFCEPAPPADH